MRETASTAAPEPRLRRLRRVLATGLRPLYPLVDAMAVAGAVVGQGVRPLTWRRPVRAEFLRFFDLAVVRAIPSVIGAGLLVGFSLVAQALYWLEQLGEPGLIRTVLVVVVVREIAPLLVALLILGRGGLMLMSDLGRMGRNDIDRALDTQGVDPFLLLIVPRVLALTLGCFCLTIVFIVAAFVSGYTAAALVGIPTRTPAGFALELLGTIGGAGYLILPVKTLLMGLAIGVIGSLNTIAADEERRSPGSSLSAGFLRSMLAIFVISGLISVLGL
jgi:phospholipid/cholesterol/gamma-HCH transport system permease protein